MSVKIRLRRQGRKGAPFYHIVAADSRVKRDGKILERIGSYNPMTNPASITLDVDKALTWLENGAQPTDTAKAILSYKGVLYKKHLKRGVKKGAFSQEEADKKFEEWVANKEAKVDAKRDSLSQTVEKEAAERLKAEKEVNETRAKAIADANAPVVEETEEAPVAEATTEENTEAEVTADETPVAETSEETVSEEPKAEEE
jgi:small subunit ribosomal protein S16